MTIDRRLANITGPLVRGLYCPSQNLIKKSLHEITVVNAIVILCLLSFDSCQRPGTSLHHPTPRQWWQISCHCLIFIGIFSKNATSYSPIQCSPTTGPRATYGPPQRYQWSADTFRKNLQIWNMLKSVWGYICLTELLALDKVHLYKNNE